jgi:hypothetical protein
MHGPPRSSRGTDQFATACRSRVRSMTGMFVFGLDQLGLDPLPVLVDSVADDYARSQWGKPLPGSTAAPRASSRIGPLLPCKEAP